MDQQLEELRRHLAEIHDLSGAAGVLGWDRQTYMPPGGALTRANQLSTLSRVIHEKGTSARLGELLDELSTRHGEEDSFEGALVRVARLEYERRRRLPTDFVAEFARARAVSSSAWEEAKRTSDFASFRPHLEAMFDYARRSADLYGYEDHPYDALLFDYDPGLKTETVRTIFAELREATVPLVKAIAARSDLADPAILEREYPVEAQREFGLEVARAFGYDFERGRLDVAVHPFASSASRDDVRITTRFDARYLPGAMFGVFHETGHALYEQNTADELARTPLARGAWSTVHESQSRTWENLVGRSRAFWRGWFPRLQSRFPDQLADVDAETFYRLVNRVRPSFIRVEADEVTYNLHIMLRFELELAVLEDTVRVAELPEAWNAKMEEYLGLTPPNDARGVLQDIHWSGAMIGYFPTYALGNVLSAQLLEAARRELGDLEGAFEAGEYGGLLGWLSERVLRHGKRYTPSDLIERATGAPLSAGPYLGYLKGKFGELYGV